MAHESCILKVKQEGTTGSISSRSGQATGHPVDGATAYLANLFLSGEVMRSSTACNSGNNIGFKF